MPLPRLDGYTIALGGLGLDSHTVGLLLLRRAVAEAGARVHYLGIQNPVGRFAEISASVEAVMISSLDGHSRYYLSGFRPDALKRSSPNPCVWCIGGNLSIGAEDAVTADLLGRGFDLVNATFRPLELVLEDLATLLHRRCRPRSVPRESPLVTLALPASAGFGLDRSRVLQQWQSGMAVPRSFRSLAAALNETAGPSMPALLRRADQEGRTLIHPRVGVPDPVRQLDIFCALAGAGADIGSVQVDSYTRSAAFEPLDRVMSETGSEFVLNGFPAVNLGVERCRELIRKAPYPVQIRHGSRDPRLLAEVTFAAGTTGYEGGPLSYTVPYFKDLPLEVAFERWSQVDRLAASYAEAGQLIDREFFGVLTATLVEPSIAIVINVLEALTSAGHGITSMSLGYGEQGCRVQDIAAMRVLRRTTNRYLERAGHRVALSTVFHQYMGAFPEDKRRAAKLIVASATTAGLAGATRIMVKTPSEAGRVPSLQDNVEAVRLVRQGLRAARTTAVDEASVRREEADLELSACAVLDVVLADFDGLIEERIIKAFAAGVLDVPFSPHSQVRGEVCTARDGRGATRFLSPGGVPLPARVVERHGELLSIHHTFGLRGSAAIARDVLIAMDTRSWPLDSSETGSRGGPPAAAVGTPANKAKHSISQETE